MRVLDELKWLADTVYQEAGGEPWEGMLGVAFVICTRATRASRSISDTVLVAKQFSAWDTESPTRLRLDDIWTTVGAARAWEQGYMAGCAAYFKLVADPTNGADHYLNVTAVSRIPRWAADPEVPTTINAEWVTAVLGRHTFMKLGP